MWVRVPSGSSEAATVAAGMRSILDAVFNLLGCALKVPGVLFLKLQRGVSLLISSTFELISENSLSSTSVL